METTIINWLHQTLLGKLMGLRWSWAVAESLHFLGMALLFGSIMVMDLRLLGYARRYVSVQHVHALTPWAIAGFSINLLTGIGFFTRDAGRYVDNLAFLSKMVLILLAGVNFLVFWFKIRTESHHWAADVDPSLSAKVVGATSIIIWILVIWGGRMIPVYGIG